MRRIPGVRIRLKDPYYKEKLMEYLRKYCAGRIVVQEDNGEEVPQDDFLVTDDVMDRRDRVVLLCFDDSGEDGVPALQPADRIAAALLERIERSVRESRGGGGLQEVRYAGKEEPGPDVDRTAERFVCVYSPQGGSGKTMFAMTLADLAARRYPEKKVLYWMMEEFPEWEEYFESDSRFTMSDGIYWSLMDEKDEFRMNLDRLAARQRNGVCFIRPCVSGRDLAELSDEQIRQFTALLAESFDLVVCDMGSAWEGINRRVLPLCGKVFLLYRDTAAGSRRLEAFLQAEESRIPGRITLVQTGGSEPAVIPGAYVLPRSPGVLIQEGRLRIPDRNSEYYECVRSFV